MKGTTIKESVKIEPTNPVLIEGLPGLGMVGKIAAQYLTKQLKAEKFAELYSPYFPYYVVVNEKGDIRLLRGEFYFWKNEAREGDLILLTGDSQAQTIKGQYEMANCILDFSNEYNVKMIVTMGGYRIEAKEKRKVLAVSTSRKLLKEATQAGAITSSTGNLIVGASGLLLGLSNLKKIDALCLLGETLGYLPDPKAAKSVLEVLQKILGMKVDLSGLDEKIEKSKEIVKRMEKIEEQRELYAQKVRKSEEEHISYIS